MLKNYLKITIAVLLRRKFLTFVNLFGTVLTLTVLVVAFAFFDTFVSPDGAQRRHDHILAVQGVQLSSSTTAMAWGSGVGPAFFAHHVEPLRTPDLVSYATSPRVATSYLDGRKITVRLRRTDADYWQILDFDLRAGRLLSADDVDTGSFVAVINEATADTYFGAELPLGKSLTLDGQPFEVIGVVANEPETNWLAFADVWVPLTATESSAYQDEWLANGQAILYVEDPSRRTAMAGEFRDLLRRFEYIPDPTQFDTATSAALTPLEELAFETLNNSPGAEMLGQNYVATFIGLGVLAGLLFMALPAINMTNLNVGRILERAPEIGLRKATGASARVLVGQFIFENVVLAALGGLLAFAVAPFVLDVLNDIFQYGRFRLNGAVFAAGLIFVAVFGVLSGAYPAWKMARLDPGAALRGQHHA
jgi:putative ABC transport system permease protein